MKSGKLINVSNRLPYRLSVSDRKLATKLSVGGLTTALLSYFDNMHGAQTEFERLDWIGVADLSKRTFDSVSPSQTIEKGNLTMHPVFLDGQTQSKFYDGFCNSVLWPLFLYFPSFADYKQDYFDEYITANNVVCKKVLEVYEDGDTIWVHDYHWMLLPSLIREQIPNAKIGFFLHIPFPSFELYKLMPKPWRTQLLSGLMGADVVGFQTEQFVKHFVDSVYDAWPDTRQLADDVFLFDNKITSVQHFSISIDYEKFNTTSQQPDVLKRAKRIREKLNVDKVVLSVDRLDYTKAISNRLEGFDLFLEQNPEQREKVTYVLVLVPTRESILKYSENKLKVECLISTINGKYSTLGWTPIVYLYKSVDFKELVALYGASDVALIVPARDGMNLVAKEYVACRHLSNGVLILSETAGAASELHDSILVNSNDRQEIAESLLLALNMNPYEQSVRMKKMQKHIKKNDVLSWASNFLNAMNNTHENVKMEYDKKY